MKTAIEIAEKEIAELWGSPSDQPTYTQIFEVLERVKPIFEQQIIDAFNEGYRNGEQETMVASKKDVSEYDDAINYFNDNYTTNKETLK